MGGGNHVLNVHIRVQSPKYTNFNEKMGNGKDCKCTYVKSYTYIVVNILQSKGHQSARTRLGMFNLRRLYGSSGTETNDG